MSVNRPYRHASHDNQARDEIAAYLAVLAHVALPGSLLEIRERHGELMRRRFVSVEQPGQAASVILRAATQRDVYVGVAPRIRPDGHRTAVAALSCLWVDADTPESIGRLQSFQPEPAMVIATGRGRHAYWPLECAMDASVGEDANRRLAEHLGADRSCADAARILRPPRTLNHRYEPARPVELLTLDSRRVALGDVVGQLPELPRATVHSASRENARASSGDPLLALTPDFYVATLLRTEVGRDRKVSCPFHRDTHPSLHVYETPAAGWHCFSCRRGGSVYDLAAGLWQLAPRGRSFLQLRDRLRRELLRGTP